MQDIWLTWTPSGRLGGLNVALGVDNLLDADYIPYQSALVAPGRNVRAALSYSF